MYVLSESQASAVLVMPHLLTRMQDHIPFGTMLQKHHDHTHFAKLSKMPYTTMNKDCVVTT